MPDDTNELEAGWAYAGRSRSNASGGLAPGAASFSEGPQWLGFRVAQTYRAGSSNTTVDAGPVSTTVDASGTSLEYEGLLFTGDYETYTADGHVYARRKAVGVRIDASVAEVKVDMSLDLVSAALAANVGVATTSVEISAPGVTWSDFVTTLPAPGVLDSEKLDALRRAVRNAYRIMSEHPDALQPQQITSYLGLDSDQDPIGSARSVRYALKRIRQGETLREALDGVGEAEVDGRIVTGVYQNVLEDWSTDTRPDRAAKERAKAYLP